MLDVTVRQAHPTDDIDGERLPFVRMEKTLT